MELSTVFDPNELQLLNEHVELKTSNRTFIQANTKPVAFEELKHEHIIPVWLKDNEPLISHADFIETTCSLVNSLYQGENILEPSVHISHPIKGRIPSAKDKPAIELLENEKTVYYERMMFAIELPSIAEDINGNRLSLTVGGVKAFNLDNLYNKKGTPEYFKVFIGFKNHVCTNLCVSTDGLKADLKVRSLPELRDAIYQLITDYNAVRHLEQMKRLVKYRMTEQQFAQMIGKARLYQFLTNREKQRVMPLRFSDTQMIAIARDYYKDENFCRSEDGTISLWEVYNLFTGANKSSYIDSFLDRAANAFQISSALTYALEEPGSNWFLS
ncbi:hypothetical protein HDC92_004746 [Pedobacter sp. AK017]|uniref:DUF3871 family protein n=1 Tax=Pedobacter sp. AK017 TaxID=2723073 RepID=UPI0016204308|nr:DUF3871 family protein [Pedobacter sp. AK017]MBB5441042.1 hypothetical protein [Pedobacter sp. AK017]